MSKGNIGTPPQAQTKPEPAKTTKVASPIDISKLSPDQLKGLRSQLKEQAKESSTTKDARFVIIDTMLTEKDEKGEFTHTTRDIINRCNDEGLLKKGFDDQVEIKKVQARKQFLEKKTDEKGNLVKPAGTFGYKKAEGAFGLTPTRIVGWFDNPENVGKLSNEQMNKLQAILKG